MSDARSEVATRWKMPDLHSPDNPQNRPSLHTAGELDNISLSAKQEGFNEGFNEGRASGLAHADVLLTRLQGVLDNLARPLTALDEEIEHELLQLTVKVSERILRKVLPTEPESLAEFIREGVELLQPSDRQISIYVNNEDAAALTELLSTGGGEGWRILPDHLLKPGDVRIQTDSGALDGTIAARLDAIFHDLTEVNPP